MKFRPNYVPKKRKWSYKIVVPFVVLSLVLVYFGYTTIKKKNSSGPTLFTACGLNVRQTKRLLNDVNKSFAQSSEKSISDYSIYGETLKLYQNKYTTKQNDPMIGQVLYITNLCSDQKVSQTLISSGDLDSGLDVSKLSDGLYTLEVLGDIDPSVLIANEPVDYVFNGIKRDGVIKRTKLFATQSFYDDEINLEKNYMLLEVSSIEDNSEFDIILDPSAGNSNSLGNYNNGHYHKGLYESDLMYELADGVEDILLAHGLRVLISRDSSNSINYYGENGRIRAAYDGKAKYYIHMRVETSGSSMDRGLLALYSNFTSNRFAQAMIQNVIKETGFQTTPYVDRVNIPGVYRTNRSGGLDNNDFLRETGGLYTGAGIVDPFDNLMSFAKNERHGMFAVNMLYGYLSDAKDFSIWESKKDLIIKGSAKGILEYLGIEYKGD